MSSSDYTSPEAALANLESLKQEGERLADLFKRHREDVRAEAIAAVTEQGVSVARTAASAGIDRRTLTVWLQVHNAEQKGRRNSDTVTGGA